MINFVQTLRCQNSLTTLSAVMDGLAGHLEVPAQVPLANGAVNL